MNIETTWLNVVSILCIVCQVTSRDLRDTATALAKLDSATELTVESLEEALSTLSNMTAAQKQAWEQQQEHEEEVKLKNREEEQREILRSTTLQEEYHLLKEIRGKISRKLRGMYRTTAKNGNAPEWLTADIRPRDCAAIYLDGVETSGVYRVWPTWIKDENGFLTYCDMDTEGGGWTVLHRWGGSDDYGAYFKRNGNEYKEGFGDLERSFWLGNGHIHALTRQGAYQLRFDAVSTEYNKSATYETFWLEDASAEYKIHVGRLWHDQDLGDVPSGSDGSPFGTTDPNSLELLEDCFDPVLCGLNTKLVLPIARPPSMKSEMKIRPARFTEMKEDVL